MKRRHFEELDVLDQGHFEFLTTYEKLRLFGGETADSRHLRPLGTTVAKKGIIVGYTSTGLEYCLFETEEEDVILPTKNLRRSRGMPSVSLLKKASDHLIKNRFRLQTLEQRTCYVQWLKTGRFSLEQAWKEIHRQESESLATEERQRMEQTHAEIRRQAIHIREGVLCQSRQIQKK